MLSALGGEHKRKAKSSSQARQLRELEKELRRKDKALAERRPTENADLGYAN